MCRCPSYEVMPDEEDQRQTKWRTNKSAVQSVTSFKPLPNEQIISFEGKTNQPNKSQGSPRKDAERLKLRDRRRDMIVASGDGAAPHPGRRSKSECECSGVISELRIRSPGHALPRRVKKGIPDAVVVR